MEFWRFFAQRHTRLSAPQDGRVQGSGFKVQGSRFGFRVPDSSRGARRAVDPELEFEFLELELELELMELDWTGTEPTLSLSVGFPRRRK